MTVDKVKSIIRSVTDQFNLFHVNERQNRALTCFNGSTLKWIIPYATFYSPSSSVTPDKYTDNLAATVLGDQVKPWQGVLIEAWITCMLVITIIGSTNMRRKGELYMATIPIGFAVTLGIMSAVSIQLISYICSDDRLSTRKDNLALHHTKLWSLRLRIRGGHCIPQLSIFNTLWYLLDIFMYVKFVVKTILLEMWVFYRKITFVRSCITPLWYNFVSSLPAQAEAWIRLAPSDPQ